MRTPSEEVAEVVIQVIKRKKLLLPDDSDKIKAKIAAGTMKSEDWLLVAEKAVENKDSDYLKVFSPQRFQSNGLRSLNISV